MKGEKWQCDNDVYGFMYYFVENATQACLVALAKEMK